MKPSRCIKNPYVDRASIPPLDRASAYFHATLPGFVPTPLRPAPETAEALGVRSVHVKDESMRIGMPAFKILGASWATYRVMCDNFGVEPSQEPSLEELKRMVKVSGKTPTLVSATDGNHGRAVARMAKLLDLSSIIYVPHDMVESRMKAISRNGADVRKVDGNYDDAVAAAASVMDDTHLVVSDTSWEGYQDCPQWVIDGYGTMLTEITDLIDRRRVPEPTVAACQVGVGAFSAAFARGFAHRPARMLVAVEPTSADCLMESILNDGEITTLAETPTTCMAGLSCGTPSPLAWPTNKAAYDYFVSTDDDHAEQATRLLYEDYINAGESGAAGLAGLLQQGTELGLNRDDDVMVILTEGVTDPVNFARIVGTQVV